MSTKGCVGHQSHVHGQNEKKIHLSHESGLVKDYKPLVPECGRSGN